MWPKEHSRKNCLINIHVFFQNQLLGGHLPHAGMADVELYHLPAEKAAGAEQHQQEDTLTQQEEAR